MSSGLLFSSRLKMPNYAPPDFAAFATQLATTWSEIADRWDGNPHVTAFDATPVALTSITSSGTTATATLTSHGLENGDKVSIRRADSAADTVYANGYNVNDTAISSVTANTFQYTMAGSTGDADATGSPVVIPHTGLWGGSSAHNLGYYGAYHSLMEYCDWLDSRGGDSSALRAVRHLPLYGELHRWRWGGSANGYPSQGYVRFPQVYSKALDEAESGVTITDMTNSRDLGAYNSTVSKINEGPDDADFPFYTQRSREFSYQWESQTHCEIQGEARITGYLTNVTMQECVEGYANNCYRWLYELYDAEGGPDTDEDYTNGHAVFMMAISCMAAIHYYDHEVSLAADPEQYWPATVMDEYSGTGSGDYITNPNATLLGTIADMAKWVFDYTGVSGTPDTDAVGKRAAYLRCHATTGGITLGDPMVYTSGGLLLSWYRTKDGTNSGTPILCMWMPVLYWLANEYKTSDPTFGTWCVDKADSIMTTSANATYDPDVGTNDGNNIKEGLQRNWYQFEGLGWRTEATGVADAPV